MRSDSYVDGFLLAVPSANKERYFQVAREDTRHDDTGKKHDLPLV